MPEHQKSRTFVERTLDRLARWDSSGRAKYFVLLAGAARELLNGDRETAGKYLSSLTGASKHDASDGRLPFPRTSYYERLTESEAQAWLRSAVKMVHYTFPGWDDSLFVACADDGELFGEFQKVGHSKAEGVDLREGTAAGKEPEGPSIASLAEINKTYRTATLISVLEYLDAGQAETLLKRIEHLTEDYLVASIPIYPDDWLDFFHADPNRVTLQTREWWNRLFSRAGFEAAESPTETLPFVTPFIFRKRKLQLYAQPERKSRTESLSAQYDAGVAPKVVLVVPDGQNTFRWVMESLVGALNAEAYPARLVSPTKMSEGNTAAAPYKITWGHFESPYRTIQVPGGRRLELFAPNYQMRPRGALSAWLEELKRRESLKIAPSSFAQRMLREIGVPYEQIEVVPHGYSPEFGQEINPLPLATHKSFRFLAVVNSRDPNRYGVDVLLEAYRREFKPTEDVCLVIRDYGADDPAVRSMIEKFEGPEILYYSLFTTKQELASFYAACSAFVAPFRGEGFGMKIVDAAVLGLPLILPLYGGPVDFCTEQLVNPVAYELKPVGECLETKQMRWREELFWCEPDVEDLGRQMRWVFEHHEDAGRRAAILRERVLKEFSWQWAARKLIRIMQG